MVGSHGPTREEWDRNPLVAGLALYSLIPNGVRPRWAAGILVTCCEHVASVPPPVKHVLELAPDESRWVLAHDAFSDVRQLTLAAQRTATDGSHYCLLHVAENAAKVIYNASGASAPFDKDCGARLVGCAKQFADHENNVDFTQQLWQVTRRYAESSA